MLKIRKFSLNSGLELVTPPGQDWLVTKGATLKFEPVRPLFSLSYPSFYAESDSVTSSYQWKSHCAQTERALRATERIMSNSAWDKLEKGLVNMERHSLDM